jgi:hypothetical protein
MSNIGRVPVLFTARRALAIVVIVGLGAFVAGAPLGATAPAKSTGPKLTFSGAVKGKAKGIHQFCNESTGLDGLQLGVSLTSFSVGKDKYSLSLSFRGAAYAAGEQQFGAPKQGATGAIVTLAADQGSGAWTSGDGNGSATLNSDMKSGKFDGELLAGSGVALTGGPGVHVKGTFKCTKIDKL